MFLKKETSHMQKRFSFVSTFDFFWMSILNLYWAISCCILGVLEICSCYFFFCNFFTFSFVSQALLDYERDKFHGGELGPVASPTEPTSADIQVYVLS